MEDCVFCKIVAGELPCYKVWEDDNFVAFLDAFPSVLGQVLVIPKKHVAPFVFDMSNEDYCAFMIVAKKVALAVDGALNPLKTGMVVEGLDLEHVHVKVFPLDKSGFGILGKKLDVSSEEMEMVADKIRGNF